MVFVKTGRGATTRQLFYSHLVDFPPVNSEPPFYLSPQPNVNIIFRFLDPELRDDSARNDEARVNSLHAGFKPVYTAAKPGKT